MSNANDKIILRSIFNPLLPLDGVFSCEEIPEVMQDTINNDKIKDVKNLEVEGVKAAETGDLDKAIQIFTAAIEIEPKWASAYNNRAQAFRLKGMNKDALVDLNKAINLSEGKGKAGCQAFCQRGLINWKEGRDKQAECDFSDAAALGSEFARTQLIHFHPYAALCNKMLHSMMQELRKPEC